MKTTETRVSDEVPRSNAAAAVYPQAAPNRRQSPALERGEGSGHSRPPRVSGNGRAEQPFIAGLVESAGKEDPVELDSRLGRSG